MKKQGKENQHHSSSLHENIRKAKFVPIEEGKKDSDKYDFHYRIKCFSSKAMLSWKRRINSFKQRPRLWASEVDWEIVWGDSVIWIVEASVEGLTANFATHFLIGLPFTPMTLLAHGIVIKQGLSVYRRMKLYGGDSKIPKKNK